LPQNCEKFPISFSEKELKFLEGSRFLENIKEKIAEITLDYEAVV